MKPGRTWYATDVHESDAGIPFSIERAAELTPPEVDFLLEAVAAWIEANDDPEGDLTELRDKLRGKA